MADEVDREREGVERFQVLRGGREDGVVDGREPGRGTAADRIEREAELARLRREGAQIDERPGAPLTGDDRRALRETARDLRDRAGDNRSIARGEDDQRVAWEDAAVVHDYPQRSDDLARAQELGADADRRDRTARADEARADSLDAEADAPPPPAAVQEPTRDRLSSTDGTQPGAHHAATRPSRRPTARRAGRAANQLPPRERGGRD